MIRWIQPGETGVDFSYTKPPPALLVAKGYTFVVGYLSPNPSKNLLNPQSYLDAGLDVLFVWEVSATSPNGGRAKGIAHGIAAKDALDAFGYPYGVPVILAFDTNSVAGNIAAHIEYFNGFVDMVSPYVVGAYEDTDLAVLTNAETTADWLPLAWSWSGGSKADAEAKARALGFHVLQLKGFYIDDLYPVDPNLCIKAFPAWSARPEAEQPTSSTKDNDMATMIFTVTGLPGEYTWTPGSDPIAFATPEDRDAVRVGLGVGPTQNLSREQYNRFFLPTPPPVTVNVPAIVVPPITVPAATVTFPPLRVLGDVLAGGKFSATITP